MRYVDIVKFRGTHFELGFHSVLHVSELQIVEAKSAEAVQHACKNRKVDIVFGTELSTEQKSLHRRGTLLTTVALKTAHQNGVAFGFSFRNVLMARPEERARLLGSMMQHVAWCRKFKVKMVIASLAENPWEMRAAHDLLAFGQVLGMHPAEAQQALSFEKKEAGLKEV